QRKNRQADRERPEHEPAHEEPRPRRAGVEPDRAPWALVDHANADRGSQKESNRRDPRLVRHASDADPAKYCRDHRAGNERSGRVYSDQHGDKDDDSPRSADQPARRDEQRAGVQASRRVIRGLVTAAAIHAFTRSSTAKGVTPSARAWVVLP